MDPVSAIGLAASILTFLDFGFKLISGTNEIYKSTTGSTEGNAHISTLTNDLRQVTADLEVDLPSTSKHEKALKSLAKECQKLSDSLLRILQRVTVSGKKSMRKSLHVGLKSMRKDREIQEIDRRLADYRSQLLLRLGLLVRDQQSAFNVQLEKLQSSSNKMHAQNTSHLSDLKQRLSHLTNSLQPDRDKGPSENQEGMQDLTRQLSDVLKTMCSNMSCIPKENIILKSLYFPSMFDRQNSIDPAAAKTFDWILKDDERRLVKHGLEHSETASGTGKSKEGLEPLQPQSPLSSDLECEHEEEEEDIGEDYTVNVIRDGEKFTDVRRSSTSSRNLDSGDEGHETGGFESDSDLSHSDSTSQDCFGLMRHPIPGSEEDKRRVELGLQSRVRSNYLSWLRIKNGIFHISGKAGSGKSTLMNFLSDHDRTQQELRVWAKKEKLIFASFFFWNSGDKLQSSLNGLYRSLLFEILRNRTELTPLLFPHEWDRLSGQPFPIEDDNLSPSAVKKAFEALISQTNISDYRLCFFIDGLDEYTGDSTDHVHLARSLRQWANNADVKICVSSRPYNEFIHVFPSSPERRIQLHDLTRRDIYLFTRQMIEEDQGCLYIKNDYLRLVNMIVEMSDGVFLWARLVVRSLLAGMLRHDTVEALKERLYRTPRDIDGLYQQLLNSLDPQDRKRAVKMLLLAAYNPLCLPLNAIVYAWIDDLTDPSFPPADCKIPAEWESPDEMLDRVQRQLAGITKGLLYVEIPETHGRLRWEDPKLTPKVHFLHRTVRDYIRETASREDLPNLQKHLISQETYFRLLIAEMIRLPILYRVRHWNEQLRWRLSSEVVGILPLNLLDALRCLLCPQTCGSLEGRSQNRDDLDMPGGSSAGALLRENLSFVHFAADIGQTRFVIREVESKQGTYQKEDYMNLLVSAAYGLCEDLVEYLLRNGFSPDKWSTWRGDGGFEVKEDIAAERAPLWLRFFLHVVCRETNSMWIQEESVFSKPRWNIIRMLWERTEADVSDCVFAFRDKHDAAVIETFDARQTILKLKPFNMEDLLSVLDKRRPGPLAAAWRTVTSAFAAVPAKVDVNKYKKCLDEANARTSHYFYTEKQLICVSWGKIVLPALSDIRLF